MASPSARDLNHFYAFGDIYETLDTCDELEMLLGRLKRQRLMTDDDWRLTKEHVAEIRGRLQRFLDDVG